MYRNLMVPVDGSSFAEHALPYAILLARATKAQLRLVLVHEPGAFGEAYVIQRQDVLDARQKAEEEGYLAALSQRVATQLGWRPETSLLSGAPATSLARQARRRETDLIVMSTHGRGGLSRAWLGSVADVLVRRAHVPTLLVRPPESEAPPKEASIARVLIAADGSPASERALTHAVTLCTVTGASCTVVRVVVPPTHRISSSLADTARMSHDALEQRTAEATEYLRTLSDRVAVLPASTRVEVVTGLNAAAAILRCAEDDHADVIAIGSRGHGAAARLLLGSVADKIVRSAHVPVLVCPDVHAASS